MVKELAATYGTQVTRQQILSVAPNYGMESNLVWLTKVRVGWGIYDISHLVEEADKAVSLLQLSPVAPQTIELSGAAETEEDGRTDSEIIAEQEEKFAILDRMVDGIVHGHSARKVATRVGRAGTVYGGHAGSDRFSSSNHSQLSDSAR